MLRRVLLVAALTGVAVPAASAQVPAPPVPPTLTLTAERVGGKRATVLTGNRFRIRGVVVPFVEGQTAVVRIYRHGRKLRAKKVALQRSASGKSGYFVTGFATSTPGRLTLKATKPATPAQPKLVARARHVNVIAARVKSGGRGLAVRELQRMLAAQGYVVGERGVFDARTTRAVQAFRKMVGMPRTFEASAEVYRRLRRGQGAFKVRHPELGRHVEANLTKQVLALIGDGGKVQRIYPISSGAPGTPTVLGTFHVYLKAFGTNQKGMVHSSYFIRGYAIHGYWSVPPYPASHGCLRVPIPDAASIFAWVRYGTPVNVAY
jgi:peptidoglycan hydrolase-like protein with peptidoglycan-binding domain